MYKTPYAKKRLQLKCKKSTKLKAIQIPKKNSTSIILPTVTDFFPLRCPIKKPNSLKARKTEAKLAKKEAWKVGPPSSKSNYNPFIDDLISGWLRLFHPTYGGYKLA